MDKVPQNKENVPLTSKEQQDIIAKQQAEIKQLKELKPKNSDDIAPGIRRTDTFHGAYRNGYENGEVAKFIKADQEKQKAEEGLQVQS